MALSKTTTDHDEIKQWAEKRGAVPAEVASTHKGKEPGILRIEFPKARNHNDDKLQEISWMTSSGSSTRAIWKLLYQEVTAAAEQSNFNKLVHPDHEGHTKSRTRKAR